MCIIQAFFLLLFLMLLFCVFLVSAALSASVLLGSDQGVLSFLRQLGFELVSATARFPWLPCSAFACVLYFVGLLYVCVHAMQLYCFLPVMWWQFEDCKVRALEFLAAFIQRLPGDRLQPYAVKIKVCCAVLCCVCGVVLFPLPFPDCFPRCLLLFALFLVVWQKCRTLAWHAFETKRPK